MDNDFHARIIDLSEKAKRIKSELKSEHMTKSALVMPFLAALGYDVFNPSEVVPEYTADVGTKRGEKVDFAVLCDGEPILLIECKPYGSVLDAGRCNQLYRYFTAKPSARIGVLTNGTQYLFFTDLDKPNIMDSRPYMEFDLEAPDKGLVQELRKLSKEEWDLDATVSSASELKYTRAIKRILAEELDSPSEDMVKFLAGKVYHGRLTPAVKEQFTSVVKRAFRDFLKDQSMERYESAWKEDVSETLENGGQETAKPKAETTEDEWQAFYLVKSIMREVVDSSRVVIRDAQNYCAVFLDDNNRKPICRLRFNASQKYIGVFDKDKNEERVPINTIDDIFSLADRLKAAAGFYE